MKKVTGTFAIVSETEAAELVITPVAAEVQLGAFIDESGNPISALIVNDEAYATLT